MMMIQTLALRRPGSREWAKALLAVGGALLALDAVYRAVAGVSYLNREQCILYRTAPRIAFLAYEHLVETALIAYVGTFAAILLASQVDRIPRLFPRNPLTAFLCAAILPVCSCAAVPLVHSLRGRRSERTTLAFVLTAPLLSPNILVLSFSVMGTAYALARVAASFVLVMVVVHTVSLAGRGGREGGEAWDAPNPCASGCPAQRSDAYLETMRLFRGLLPWLAIAGVLGLGLDLLAPEQLLRAGALGGPWGASLIVLAGVPLYLCHGSEVLLLRPLAHHGVGLGTAVGFSLTSTAVCLTSLAMLARFMGRRRTIVLTAAILITALALSAAINWLAAT